MWCRPMPPGRDRMLVVLGIVLALAGVAAAAPGDVDRLAGGLGVGPATSVAQVPNGLAVRDGALYVADPQWAVVRRIDLATGHEDIVAGAGLGDGLGDGGPATSAHLFGPAGIVFDAVGNLLIAESEHRRVRRVDAIDGTITTIAGSDAVEHAGDGGPATASGFSQPIDVAVAPSGDLFIADAGSNRIRRVDAATGIISTFAGTGDAVYAGDGGPATSASFSRVSAIAIDPAGRLLIADRYDQYDGHRIRRVESDGTIDSIYVKYYGGRIVDLAVAADGTMYLTMDQQTWVVRVDGAWPVTVAGPWRGFGGDGGPATNASMDSPYGLAFDESGNLFVADRGNERIRRIDRATKIITTIAGTGSCCSGGDGGDARGAQVGNEHVLGSDLSGNVLAVNQLESRVRRIDVRTGHIQAVAGSGESGFSGDGGPAVAARLKFPASAVGDARGNVFIADSGNARIRRVDGISGVITTVAGTGVESRSNDGALARTSAIGQPRSMAIDRDGNLYFVELVQFPALCSVRRIDATSGTLGTVIGGTGCSELGDGGPAREAGIGAPVSIALDPRGGMVLLTADHVRRIDFATGIVERIFGTEDLVFTPDGMPAAGSPTAVAISVAVDSAGNVYVGEQDSFRVRRIDAATGLLSTVIGTGVNGRSGAGDGGPASLAEISFPDSIVVTHTDRLYVAEGYPSRIRVVASGPRCGDWTVDPGESCDDGNLVGDDCCSPTCILIGVGTVCRASTGECDPAEVCDGASGLCPAPAFVASEMACTTDGNVCTDDVCDGAGSCLHRNNSAPCTDNVFCNGPDSCSRGACSFHPGNPCFDGPECANACDEAHDTCNVVAGLPCSLDDSFCTDDVCDGHGACSHPPARAGETCRASGGGCDVAEVCDGVSPDCPADAFLSPTVVCRAAAGECDRAESCTGSSPQCPANTFATSGTSCTPDANVCTADMCDGGGACTHPAGNAGVQCRAAAGVCDVAELCDGVSSACPADRFRPATVVCRDAAGECDRAETCSGTSAQCRSDAFVAAGTSCTPDALQCTSDVCDGSGECTHPAGNAGVQCRASSGVCDLAESCDGSSVACPDDAGATDTDQDGACDAQDPCTNEGGGRDFLLQPRSSLVLTRVHTDRVAGDDGVKLTASFALPEERSFAELRPHLHGVRLVIEGAGGSRPLDAALPPGAYSAATRYGWKPSGSGKSWTFLDRRATPVNGIVKLSLTDCGRAGTPRQVKAVVTGKNGAYPVAPTDLPLQVRLTLGDATDAAAGLCAESAYASTSCAFNGAGNQLVCLR